MNYGLYIAKVVGVGDDDRLQVRVLPHMGNSNDIPDEQCPRWSSFFRERLFSGTAASNEYVWVICNEEFTAGYVLGLANYTTYIGDDSSYKEKAIPSDLKDIASNALVSLQAEKLNFNNIDVTFWNADSIHFVERSSGGSIIAFRNGSLYVARPDEFIIALPNSKFIMNSNGISFSGASINLGSDNVHLGNDADANVLVTTGADGSDARASKCAWA